MKDSPEASSLLTLHNINKMLPEIYKVVVFQLNKTRKVPGGKLWKHGSEASLTTVFSLKFRHPIFSSSARNLCKRILIGDEFPFSNIRHITLIIRQTAGRRACRVHWPILGSR